MFDEDFQLTRAEVAQLEAALGHSLLDNDDETCKDKGMEDTRDFDSIADDRNWHETSDEARQEWLDQEAIDETEQRQLIEEWENQ